MLIYINPVNLEVTAYNTEISKIEASSYVDNINSFWFDGELPSLDDVELTEGKSIKYYMDEKHQVITAQLEDTLPQLEEMMDHEEITKEVHTNVEISSVDNLINMDMLIALDEKLNTILEHLGL